MTVPGHIEPRTYLSKKRRLELLLAFGGKCGICREKIIDSFDVDHRIALEAGGTNEWDNLQPAHPACHKAKTAKLDAPKGAKINRIVRKSDPATRKTSKRPIPTRDFDTRLTKKMDGSVVPRSFR
jgi:5-methylcytosine-specific restriction enzyme A